MDAILQYDDDSGEEEVFHPNDIHHTKCMVCSQAVKQYKCPACSIFTCSLMCCKKHKVQSGCTGKRDRASYVSMQQYNERNLVQDYHFLEDVLQTKQRGSRIASNTEGTQKSKIANSKFKSRKNMDKKIPPRYIQQLDNATKCREVNWLMMPEGMSKRLSNTTKYIHNIDTIFWKIDIVFIINDKFTMSEVLSSNGDTGIRSNIVGCDLRSIKESTVIKDMITSNFFELSSTNGTVRHALRPLRLNQSRMICLIQHIPSSASDPLFHEIPLDFSIKDALKGKTVIENPTFFIGLRDFMLPKFRMKITTINDEISTINFNVIDEDGDEDDSTNDEQDDDEEMDEQHVNEIRKIVSEIGKRSLDDLDHIADGGHLGLSKRLMISSPSNHPLSVEEENTFDKIFGITSNNV